MNGAVEFLPVTGAYLSVTDIAAELNTSPGTVGPHLRPEEREQMILGSRIIDATPHAKYVPAQTAENIMRRMCTPPPAHLAPSTLFIRRTTGITRSAAKARIRRMQFPSEYVRIHSIGGADPTRCFSWASLQQYEAKWPSTEETPDTFPLWYEDLPASAEDTSSPKLLYAHLVQAHYLPMVARRYVTTASLASEVLGIGEKTLQRTVENLGFAPTDDGRVALEGLVYILPDVARLATQ